MCRQLGYTQGASSVTCCSPYGAVPTSFSYDEVGCLGTESTLDACPHQNTHDCGAGEGVGLVCTLNSGSPISKLKIFLASLSST